MLGDGIYATYMIYTKRENDMIIALLGWLSYDPPLCVLLATASSCNTSHQLMFCIISHFPQHFPSHHVFFLSNIPVLIDLIDN